MEHVALCPNAILAMVAASPRIVITKLEIWLSCGLTDGTTISQYKSKESIAAYHRLVGEWLLKGAVPPSDHDDAMTLAELMVAYLRHANTYYVKNGKITAEFGMIKNTRAHMHESLLRTHMQMTQAQMPEPAAKSSLIGSM